MEKEELLAVFVFFVFFPEFFQFQPRIGHGFANDTRNARDIARIDRVTPSSSMNVESDQSELAVSPHDEKTGTNRKAGN